MLAIGASETGRSTLFTVTVSDFASVPPAPSLTLTDAVAVPGFNDSGTATASVSVNDGAGGTDAKSLTVTVNNVDRPVSLAPIASMVVTAAGTADQTFTATDPDGDAITFTNTGPTF